MSSRSIRAGFTLVELPAVSRRKREAFISVGAVSQRSTFEIMEMALSHSLAARNLPPHSAAERNEAGFGAEPQDVDHWGGTRVALPSQSVSEARRLDSSLRSHRISKSQCSLMSSELDKTLFASTGPNSLGR